MAMKMFAVQSDETLREVYRMGRPNRYQIMNNLELLCAYETCVVKNQIYPDNKTRREELYKCTSELCKRLDISEEDYYNYRKDQ